MAAEGVVMARQRRRSGRGPALGQVLPTLASGAALVLALLLALTAAPPLALLPCLGAALLAHIVDLRSRWPD